MTSQQQLRCAMVVWLTIPLLVVATDFSPTAGNTSTLKSPTYTAPQTSQGYYAPPKKTIYSGAVAAPQTSPANPYSARTAVAAAQPAYSTPDAATAAYTPPELPLLAAAGAPSYSEYPANAAALTAASTSGGGYGSQTTGVDDYNYQHEIEEPSGFDFIGRFLEAIPLVLSAAVAFLLAQLVAPWLYQLFLVAVSLVPIGLGFKAPLLNALLVPFGLTLCTTTPTLAVYSGTGGLAIGRELSEDQWEAVNQITQRGIEVLRGK
jgi:hypothetical protein